MGNKVKYVGDNFTMKFGKEKKVADKDAYRPKIMVQRFLDEGRLHSKNGSVFLKNCGQETQIPNCELVDSELAAIISELYNMPFDLKAASKVRSYMYTSTVCSKIPALIPSQHKLMDENILFQKSKNRLSELIFMDGDGQASQKYYKPEEMCAALLELANQDRKVYWQLQRLIAICYYEPQNLKQIVFITGKGRADFVKLLGTVIGKNKCEYSKLLSVKTQYTKKNLTMKKVLIDQWDTRMIQLDTLQELNYIIKRKTMTVGRASVSIDTVPICVLDHTPIEIKEYRDDGWIKENTLVLNIPGILSARSKDALDKMIDEELLCTMLQGSEKSLDIFEECADEEIFEFQDDSLRHFCDDFIIGEPSSWVVGKEFREAYREYCGETESKAVDDKAIVKYLRNRFNMKILTGKEKAVANQPRNNIKKYTGISWKTEVDEEEDV